MKYYICVDTVDNHIFNSEVNEMTQEELDKAGNDLKAALQWDDHIVLKNSGNMFIIKCEKIVAAALVKVK